MKVEIRKSELLSGLQMVQNVVSTRSTLPILSHVLIRAADAWVQLSTTDLDVAIRCNVNAKVGKAGVCTAPVRRLASLVRELPQEEVLMEADAKGGVNLRCGSSFYRIVGLPAEEFPALPKFDKPRKHQISQSKLREILRLTTYAVSTDVTRYVLNGVLMSFKSGKLTAVATDGRRLALYEEAMEIGKENEQEVIVPAKAVSELERVLSDEGKVEMMMGENQMGFELSAKKAEGKKKTDEGEGKEGHEGMMLVTKLIAGHFPNFRQVIPTEQKERVTLEREPVLRAIQRASVLTSEKNAAVKLTFGKNQLTISANAPDVGEAKESIPVKFSGKEIGIGFNPSFLIDPLRHLDTDEVSLELTDELSPMVIKTGGGFLYVVMPLRLS